MKLDKIALNEIIDVIVSDETIKHEKKWKHKTLEERAAEYGEELNFDGEYDWGEPVGREIW